MKSNKHPFSPEDLDEVAHEIELRQKAAKAQIIQDWLPRYTGMPLDKFGKYILLVNFGNYVRMFAEKHAVEVYGLDKTMQAATAEKTTAKLNLLNCQQTRWHSMYRNRYMKLFCWTFR